MEFEWPWQYKFPPFYTLQPNLDTRQKQLEGWCALVLAYHRHHKQYSLDVQESQATSLFHNKEIDRKLNIDAIYAVLEELQKKGNVEWTDKTRKQCLVMWRTPEEWGKLIYHWVSNNGLMNTVCTLFELVNGDDTAGEDFHGLEMPVLMRALQTLQQQRKAEIMGTDGVKFF